ncbi:phosphoesterase [Legionella sp. W05-934-2]|jgi:intracellular multiplication protein IcmM|uniref:phosphoesterase n=1 Tax=Legionella sp. W05-934-2 TaxID=1198649 RepID=UPI003461F153
MSKEAWYRKLESIQFYIVTFRRLSGFLLVSFIVNVIFGVLIYFKYFHQGDHVYYATNGIVSPEKLTPRDEPNFSSEALLATPKTVQEASKPIPD